MPSQSTSLSSASSPVASWSCGGASVLGANHLRSGAPNQDAIAWWPDAPPPGAPLMLAVADGHGSDKSFRSHLGSALAVQIALEQFQRWFQLSQPHRLANWRNDLENLQQQLRQELPQCIVTTWQQQVRQRMQAQPFTPEEIGKLKAKEGDAAVDLVSQYPEIAYGATLLTVFVTPWFICYLQLGDGDILCVDERGQTYRPLAEDPSLIANETTSLCMPQAWKFARLSVQPPQSRPPVLILVSTDGYANSFISDTDFCQIGPDYFQMIQADGFTNVLSQLEPILQEATQQGSGDDITLGLMSQIQPLTGVVQPAPEAAPQTPNQITQHHRPSTSTTLSRRRPSRYTHSSTHKAPGTGQSTQFQVPAGQTADPTVQATQPSTPPPTSQGVDSLQQIQALQQANQRLKHHVQTLRLGLGLALGFAFLSLAGAGYLFWRYRQLEDQNQPSMTPTPTVPSSTPSVTGQPALPANQPSPSPSTDLTPELTPGVPPSQNDRKP